MRVIKLSLHVAVGVTKIALYTSIATLHARSCCRANAHSTENERKDSNLSTPLLGLLQLFSRKLDLLVEEVVQFVCHSYRRVSPCI